MVIEGGNPGTESGLQAIRALSARRKMTGTAAMTDRRKPPLNPHLVVFVAVVALPLALLVLGALALAVRHVLRLVGVF